MSSQFTAGCFCLALAAALSACGPTATPGLEKTSVIESLSSPTNTPAETAAVTDVVGPAVSPTPAVADPLPGLVYTAPVPDKGMAGPFLVEANGESTQLSDKTAPALSSDRSRLLYLNNDDIWILDLQTGKTRNLTKTNDRLERYYQWWPSHPDLIVFHYQPADDPGPDAGYLASIKPDGTNYLLLDEEARSFSPAALSPDGQSIAYDRAGQPWVYHFAAGKMPIFPKSFTGFHLAVNPAWSPDSRRIAWQLFGMPTEQDSGSAVGILDLDALTVTERHKYSILGGSGIGPDHLAWSPDGKWLAIANQAEFAEDGKISLWVIQPDGSEEHHLGSGDLPIWNPDGTILLYTSAAGTFAVKAGEWVPRRILLPEGAQVIDWVELE
ncbi:MAG: PD40 domain-containing protein [Anaerolineales bacterium]|nr:PD40 domain-containing protein [Anaerolineales bacterium]